MKQQIQQLSFLSLQMLHEAACEAQCGVTRSKWELAACLLATHRSLLHEDHGCSSTVVYAQRVLGLDAHVACELLRAARALETLPLISDAFQAGRLSWSKVRELTRHATPESDKEWLDLALPRTADEIQRTASISPRRFAKAKADASTNRDATEQPTLPASPKSATPSAEQPTPPGPSTGRDDASTLPGGAPKTIAVTFHLTPTSTRSTVPPRRSFGRGCRNVRDARWFCRNCVARPWHRRPPEPATATRLSGQRPGVV